MSTPINLHARIAPTPSGMLHLGNAFNFLLTFLLVQKFSGRLTLRIDDLDQPRVRTEYLQNIFDVLYLLQISWDYGPKHVNECPEYSQLNRLTLYQNAIDTLHHNNHLFACTCSRKELVDTARYSGHCLSNPANTQLPFQWRLYTPKTPITFTEACSQRIQMVDVYNELRHPVIVKKDGLPAYQLASLVDDVNMGINLIVRGKDLLESTATQLYLAQLLHFSGFASSRFVHHELVLADDHHKLSKSAGSSSVISVIEQVGVAGVYIKFAQWLRLPEAEQLTTISRLSEAFNVHYPCVFT